MVPGSIARNVHLLRCWIETIQIAILSNTMNTPPEIDKLAFESKEPDRGYTCRANYLKPPHGGDALVEIFKDGQPVREFLFPAYKIWNIAAHFRDIVDSEISKDAHGYEMADWNGLPTPSRAE
jgi:hypothetical protein